MSDQKKQTLIEEGTTFKGDFDSDCPIIVKGNTEGRLKAPSLTVSPTGSVSGTVKVKELRSEGALAGEYDADFVQLSGSIKNNTVIRARALEVNLTPREGRMQVVFGECELEVGEVPTKEEAVAKASAGWKPGSTDRPDAPSSSSDEDDGPATGKSKKDAKDAKDGRRNSTVPPDAR